MAPVVLSLLLLLATAGLTAILINRGGSGSAGTAPATGTASGATTTAAYAQTCRIKAWYSSYLPGGSYIHFKCVDERTGTTVDEALGSDHTDLAAEAERARVTAARVTLVEKLKRQLEHAGWHAIGTVAGGEWYQLRFGR